MRITHAQQHTFLTLTTLVGIVLVSLFALIRTTDAAPNYQMNYQGKLTNAANVAVADGTYNMRFWLLTTPSIATTSAVWTESLTGTSKVQVTNGLFSVMLGSTSPLTGVDFNQTLYLGVEIGGTSTPAWDGEMSPRKVLGTVPAAFEANKLDGLDSTQFVRTDATSTIATSSVNTLLTLTQSGVGDIFNLFDGTTEVFTMTDGGRMGLGTTSPSRLFTMQGGDFWLGGNMTATGTLTVSGLATFGDFIATNGTTTNATSTNLRVSGLFTLGAGQFTSLLGTGFTNSANVLTCLTANGSTQGCLTGADWTTFMGKVASSSIDSLAEIETLTSVANILIENDIDASSELAALMDDETGSGFLVFSGSPVFTGGATFSGINVTATSTLGYASSTALTVANNAYLNTYTANSGTTTNASSTNLFATNGRFTNATIGSSAGVLTTNSTGLVSASTTIGDSYITDALTLGGGAIGSNNIAGTLTTTGTLTIGDGGDIVNFNTSSWDVTSGAFTGITNLSVTGSSTVGGGTGATGLTINGTATSTNLKVTSLTPARALFTGADNLFTTTGTSQYLIDSLSDETGTGIAVFGTNPLLSGFRSNASSTIGGGTDTTGLTINGGATTTGNAYVAGRFEIGPKMTNISALSVVGSVSGSDDFVALKNSNNAGYSEINFMNDSGSHVGSIGYANTGAGSFTDEVYLNAVGKSLALSTDGAGTPLVFLTSSQNVGIGTTTPTSRLTMDKSGFTGSGVAGIKQYLGFTNSTLSALYYGDETYITNVPTATSTLVGKMIRIADTSALGNTIRGLEVQAHRGTNTKGENTGIAGFGRTFGVRGSTMGDAGSTYLPAGIFAETEGTTQGNALRAYSGTITSENLVYFFQDTSNFTGTGLKMDFGNAGGSFAATSSAKFLDFKVGGTSKFYVAANGSTTIGDGTVSAGLRIPYGGICVDNDGSCVSTTTGQIRSVTSALGNSDLAEMYFSNQSLRTGEIVSLSGGLSVKRASESTEKDIIGVVSTKPGMTLGFDDSSLALGETGFPIGLKGRVPIRLSTENGEIQKGDRIALSSIPGVGMKAKEGDRVVGIALEDYNGTKAYSSGFLNQFGDDMLKERVTVKTVLDPHSQDGCYNGGGNALGENPCVAQMVATTTVINENPEETRAQMLAELRNTAPEQMAAGDGETYAVGQVIMFIELAWYQGDRERMVLSELATTTPLFEGSEVTLWDNIKALASSFVDGVLSVTGLKADRVEVKNELCVDGVCVTADDLRAILQSTRGGNETSGDTGGSNETNSNETGGGEVTGGDSGTGSESGVGDSSGGGDTSAGSTGGAETPVEPAPAPTPEPPVVEEPTPAEPETPSEPAPEPQPEPSESPV